MFFSLKGVDMLLVEISGLLLIEKIVISCYNLVVGKGCKVRIKGADYE